MNESKLRKEVAASTGLPEETVGQVMSALVDTVQKVLNEGDQLHWGSFIRAWTVLKRPATAAGKPICPDKPGEKIRYHMPCCTFAGKIVQPMKKNWFNMENGQPCEPFKKEKRNHVSNNSQK